ncbi:MAG TPA: acyl-CoA dehydrogenase family protein [Ktedonobacteraceae bacterium]|nr:acyl-CoA dehydrogenase family protein [Ktedonobacteraceae bacterium]
MRIELTSQQRRDQEAFRAFVEAEIIPQANWYDQEERTPPELIQKVAQKGYLGALVPQKYGGAGMDMITFGLLAEELGRGCSSIRSLLTVHSMVIHALLRWGSSSLKTTWLPRLASGEVLGAFGLSEPNVGSDAQSVETTAILHNGVSYVLNGVKKWTTYGQIANLYLIFAQYNGSVSAFLVERDRPGLSIEPLTGILGTHASMLAEIHLYDCCIPTTNLVGGRGFGIASVATSALDIGRYTVAWGCVGIAQACLEASLRYSSERKQFGVYLKEHQLIQQMITNMLTNVQAARLLCYQAGYLKDIGDPGTVMETWIAKYFASTTASQAARDAVQIHGANGCSSDYDVQRYLRDAVVMEIIEGSTQIQQTTIANYAYQHAVPSINAQVLPRQ